MRVRLRRRGRVIPPTAGLVERDDDRRVLPVLAGLDAADQVTDEGVIGDRAGIAGVAVERFRCLDP